MSDCVRSLRGLGLLFLFGVGGLLVSLVSIDARANPVSECESAFFSTAEGSTSQEKLNNSLFRAAQMGSIECSKYFLEKGAQVGFEQDGRSLLFLISSTKGDDARTVDLLLKSGADPNVKFESLTPLCAAARANNPRIAKLLAHHRTTLVNERCSSDGSTALHEAAENESFESLEALLESPRIDLNSKRGHSETVLDILSDRRDWLLERSKQTRLAFEEAVLPKDKKNKRKPAPKARRELSKESKIQKEIYGQSQEKLILIRPLISRLESLGAVRGSGESK